MVCKTFYAVNFVDHRRMFHFIKLSIWFYRLSTKRICWFKGDIYAMWCDSLATIFETTNMFVTKCHLYAAIFVGFGFWGLKQWYVKPFECPFLQHLPHKFLCSISLTCSRTSHCDWTTTWSSLIWASVDSFSRMDVDSQNSLLTL